MASSEFFSPPVQRSRGASVSPTTTFFFYVSVHIHCVVPVVDVCHVLRFSASTQVHFTS